MIHTNQKIIKHKVGLLNLADELGNISKACKTMGVSRDTFYLSFTTPIDIFLKPVVKGLIRYSGILFCHLFNTSSKA